MSSRPTVELLLSGDLFGRAICGRAGAGTVPATGEGAAEAGVRAWEGEKRKTAGYERNKNVHLFSREINGKFRGNAGWAEGTRRENPGGHLVREPQAERGRREARPRARS